MTTRVDELCTIHIDEFLPHPPARVWRALTEPELLARCLMPNDFKPVVGHRFTFRRPPLPSVKFGGVSHCEVLAIEPQRLLRISWVDRDTENGLHSTVTWCLEPEGGGTRLFLEHDGFDPENPYQQLSRNIMAGGWRPAIQRLGKVISDIELK